MAVQQPGQMAAFFWGVGVQAVVTLDDADGQGLKRQEHDQRTARRDDLGKKTRTEVVNSLAEQLCPVKNLQRALVQTEVGVVELRRIGSHMVPVESDPHIDLGAVSESPSSG